MKPFAPGGPIGKPSVPETPARVLPADVYDTLELMAYAYGGVGAYSDYDDEGCPFCIHGAAREAVGAALFATNPVAQALYEADISRAENDEAVADINRRLGRGPKTRVTFRRWVKQLGVVRGDA